jgi:hypothetical protein
MTTMQHQFSINVESFQLFFAHLFREGCGLSFPCDASGRVELDELSARGRLNYFYARTLLGRDFAMPTVRRV